MGRLDDEKLKVHGEPLLIALGSDFLFFIFVCVCVLLFESLLFCAFFFLSCVI